MLDPGFLGLVREHVRSVWALELLLLMRRHAHRAWKAGDLVKELRASQSVVGDSLGRFEISGLIARDGGAWRYQPANAELAAFGERLAEEFQTRPVAMINLIASQGRIQGLADAFRIKGPDE